MPDNDTQDPWDSRRPDVHSATRGHSCIHDPSAAAALAFGIIASLSFTLKANAQSASGLISTWGKACRMRVVEQFDMPMCDALVNIAATEKQSIDDGTMTPKDIKKSGMSYNWQFRGKNVSGYCNVNGKGKITEFKTGRLRPTRLPSC